MIKNEMIHPVQQGSHVIPRYADAYMDSSILILIVDPSMNLELILE